MNGTSSSTGINNGTGIAFVSDPSCRNVDDSVTLAMLILLPISIMLATVSWNKEWGKITFSTVFPTSVLIINHFFVDFASDWLNKLASYQINDVVLRYITPVGGGLFFLALAGAWNLGYIVSTFGIIMFILLKFSAITTVIIAICIAVAVCLFMEWSKWKALLRTIIVTVNCTLVFCVVYVNKLYEDQIVPECGEQRNIMFVCNQYCPVATDNLPFSFTYYIVPFMFCVMAFLAGIVINAFITRIRNDWNNKQKRRPTVKVPEHKVEIVASSSKGVVRGAAKPKIKSKKKKKKHKYVVVSSDDEE